MAVRKSELNLMLNQETLFYGRRNTLLKVTTNTCDFGRGVRQ